MPDELPLADAIRDPRVDPKPGDILRHGETYNGYFHEVLPHDPRLMSWDISSICDGEENSWSLNQWRKWAATAEVIRRAEDTNHA